MRQDRGPVHREMTRALTTPMAMLATEPIAATFKARCNLRESPAQSPSSVTDSWCG